MWLENRNAIPLLRYGSLIVVLILVLSSCKKEQAKVDETVVKPRRVSREIAPVQEETKEEKFLYAHHDKRDPFVPLVDRKGRPIEVVEGGAQFRASDLYLEGIMWDPVKPMAIINDEIVSSGDKISGVTVTKIEKNRVLLNYQDKEFELKIE